MVDNLDNGQISVKLDMIMEQLQKLSKEMVTKDVFDVWKQGNADRIGRLESDMGKLVQESAGAHVSLDKDSKARHLQTEADIETLRVYIENRFQEAEARQNNIDEGIKNRKNAMAGVWVAVSIGGALTVAGLILQLMATYR